MYLKNLKFKPFLINLLVSVIYPILAFSAGETEYQRILNLTNALTVTGLVMLVAGIFYSFYLHGDFDLTSYIARRTAARMAKRNEKPFDAYREDRKEKREDKANYPLLTGILMLLFSAVLTVTCF